jgi:hypothetical protein
MTVCIHVLEREQLQELAANTADPLLANAILLILRGESLPPPVASRLLNACASLLDAHDYAAKLFGGPK